MRPSPGWNGEPDAGLVFQVFVTSPAEDRFMAKRTTHRSSKGTKLYAVRDKKGRFKDIQTYKRAHSADLRRKAKNEK